MLINQVRQIVKDKFNSDPKCHSCDSKSTILDGSSWTCWQHIKVKLYDDKTVGESSED